MLGVLKRKWKPKRASSNSNHHQNNNQNGRVLDAAGTGEGRAAPSARQIHPLYGEKAQLLAYEADALLHHHHHLQQGQQGQHANKTVVNEPAASPPPAPPYLAVSPAPPLPPLPPLPPAYPLAPNICVEGGRIEFVRPTLDGAALDTKERAALAALLGQAPPPPPPSLPPPPIPPHGVSRQRAGSIGTVSRAQQTLPLPGAAHSEEKCDLAKESLEARISELEELLDSERRCCQKERSAVQRLQRQLAKREAARRDVDRERFLRLDSAAEAEQCKARLAALQRDLARMEEALRCMLQYKTRCSQLKQDKTALAAAYEARVQQCQTTISKLSQENEALKKQVKSLEAQQGGAAVQQALLERLRVLEADNRLLSSDAEQQRRQYERCLDDVANQVVRALLSQKGLREEISALQQRIRELETQNRALTTLLVQQLQHRDPDCKQIAAGLSLERGLVEAVSDDMVTLSKPRLRRPAGRHRPAPSCSRCGQHGDDPTAAILAAVASIDPALWLQIPRPQSLNLAPSLEGAQESGATVSLHSQGRIQVLDQDAKADEDTEASSGAAEGSASSAGPREGVDAEADAAVAEAAVVAAEEENGSSSPESSPESGNRDEGYSTMSSDVQVEASSSSLRLGDALPAQSTSLAGPGPELEDVKEEDVQDVTPVARLLLVDLQALSARHSFPPARELLQYQHVMRSLSDSNLCLKLMSHARHAPLSLASTPASCPAAPISAPSPKAETGMGKHPLRRARATASLLQPTVHVLAELGEHDDDRLSGDTWSSGGTDLVVDGAWWDSDYVQHWLRLDETRSALQQQHREALELEYDQAELEDWSMSCEDLSWRRLPPPAPEAASTPHQLPSIQENNALELEEDSSECLWNNASYMDAELGGGGVGGKRGCRIGGGDCGGGGGALLVDGGLGVGWPYALQEADMISSMAVNAASPSWSSAGTASNTASDCSNDCCLNGCHGEDGQDAQDGQGDSSKRSSAALSGCSDESPTVGTDFTRDFYRLVKFESTKSLASNSSSRSRNSHSRGDGNNINVNINNNNLPASLDREQALQSVLKFIAEQQKYCHSREEQDELGSRPTSYTMEDEPRSLSAYSDPNSEPVSEPQHETNKPVADDEIDEQGEDDGHLFPAATHSPEEVDVVNETLPVDVLSCAHPAIVLPVVCSLRTVIEDEELDTAATTLVPRDADEAPSVLVRDANDKAVSFHERASSKDVIDELNRMIRKGEGDAEESSATPCAQRQASQGAEGAGKVGHEGDAGVAAVPVNMDTAFCCPTGWVHVERDIDFTDPKARANLLDVMLASSASSGSMSSSSSESSEDLPRDYTHLHRLHRFRRHKKASAFREPFGVLRLPSSGVRPTIIGRDDFFVRYGEKEREAISTFDFLDDMSTASISGASSTLGSLQRLDSSIDQGLADALADDAVGDAVEDDGDNRGTPTPLDNLADDSDERTGEQLSLSDSCGNLSLSGSRSSLEEQPAPVIKT